MSGYISTHVLNLVSGKPGLNIPVRLLYLEKKKQEAGSENTSWKEVSQGKTNSDGRVSSLYGEGAGTVLIAGRYRLEFDLDGYFDTMGLSSFLPEAVIGFEVAEPGQHYHVPLLLSPNGFSTYRGS